LKTVADNRIGLKIIDQVCPSARAGTGAVNEYYGDLTSTIRFKSYQLNSGSIEEAAVKKTPLARFSKSWGC